MDEQILDQLNAVESCIQATLKALESGQCVYEEHPIAEDRRIRTSRVRQHPFIALESLRARNQRDIQQLARIESRLEELQAKLQRRPRTMPSNLRPTDTCTTSTVGRELEDGERDLPPQEGQASLSEVRVHCFLYDRHSADVHTSQQETEKGRAHVRDQGAPRRWHGWLMRAGRIMYLLGVGLLLWDVGQRWKLGREGSDHPIWEAVRRSGEYVYEDAW